MNKGAPFDKTSWSSWF